MINRNRAFSLVEVLLALGIFGFSVLGLLGAMDAIMDAAREARIEQRARQELASRLAALEDGRLIETERVVAREPLVFTETIRRESVVNARRETLDGFWRIKVVAKWTAGGEPRNEEASILRYLP